MKAVDRLKGRARALKAELVAVYYAFQDPRVRFLPRAIIGLALAYSLSPIDLIPDFIPILGYLDDLVIVPALIGAAIRLIPREVMDDARSRAEAEPLRLKKNWAFAALFIAVWILVPYSIVRAAIRLAR